MSNFQLSSDINTDKIFLRKRSELEERWDPYFYNQKFSTFLTHLSKNNKLVRFSYYIKSITNGLDQRDFFDSGTPYYKVANVLHGKLSKEKIQYIRFSNDLTKNIKLEKNDILLTRKGSYGRAYRVLENNDAIISSEIFNIKLKISKYAEFIEIYLNLFFGQIQFDRHKIGAIMGSLSQIAVKNIFIPEIDHLPFEKICILYRECSVKKQQKEQEAQALLDSIDEYLMEELGIELPEIDNSLENRIFKTSFSNVIGNRLDPYGYLKKFEYLVDAIAQSKYPSKPLKEFVTNSCSGNWGEDPNSLQANIIEEYTICTVIRGTELNDENIILEDKKNKRRAILTERLTKLNIKSFDFLIEKSGGSEKQPVGRIGLITPEILYSQAICFSNFLQKFTIELDEMNPYYLFFYLRFTYGIGITENMQSQTNGIRNLISKEYFEQKIIAPPIKKQNEIVAHIQSIREKAKQLQNEAQEQFEEAKRDIERMILGEDL